MNLKDHHTKQELQTLYRTEKDARLARRMHAIYLAARGLSCPQIMTITGAARRTIQQWVRKYNKQGIDGLKDKPRPGQPTKLPRRDEPRFCKRIEAGPTKKDGVVNLPDLTMFANDYLGCTDPTNTQWPCENLLGP